VKAGRGCARVMRNVRWGGATALAAVLIASGTAAADRPVHEIQITATRYAFDPVTIQVNTGEAVRIVIRSKDGVHGFSIPKLKIDVQVPKSGDPVTVEFTAPAVGRYEIACSEFCGSGHSQMRAALISIGPTQTGR
jgi:cytochrome c oxidase subunit II